MFEGGKIELSHRLPPFYPCDSQTIIGVIKSRPSVLSFLPNWLFVTLGVKEEKKSQLRVVSAAPHLNCSVVNSLLATFVHTIC